MGIPRIPLGGSPVPNSYSFTRRVLSCWHLLSVIMTIGSTVFACYMLLKNVMFFRNVDNVVEHCTIDWESYYPCHFLHLWWTLNDRNSIYDLRCFLNTLFLFTIAVAAHYIFAGIIMVVGMVKQSHLAFIPWLVVKAVVILFVSGLVMAEVFITGGSITSKYFMVAVAVMVYSVFHWVFCLVTFSQIRKVNQRIQEINSFNYIRFAE